MNISCISDEQCYGCSACFSICPVHAIDMSSDNEGFLRPIVNEANCIDCAKCTKVCPVLNTQKLADYAEKKYLALRNSNADVVKKSSSGGVFALLAEYVLENKGVVYGAAFDKCNILHHERVDSLSTLERLMGSKYVQSDLGHIFSQVKADLKNNKKVLFVGTPCQVAGLKAFIRKEYDNLITADLLCHGVPSPAVWQSYLHHLGIENSVPIEFRNKSEGWKNYHMVVGSVVNEEHEQNSYMKGFLQNLYLRKSCYNCQFCGTQRCADFTLGDFWGAGLFRKSLDDDTGTSIILLNSLKAQKVFEHLSAKFDVCEQVEPYFVASHNISLLKPAEKNKDRGDFFEDFRAGMSWDDLCQRYLHKPSTSSRKIGILNLQNSHNFGACLVTFALQNVIQKLGYKVEVIDFRPENRKHLSAKQRKNLQKLGQAFESFRKKFLIRSRVCFNFDDLCELNSRYDTFVVGSDQVWRYGYVANYLPEFFLKFADDDKVLLSYAASFGVDYWEGDDKSVNEVSQALKRFQAISVREKSGEKICHDVFGVEAQHVLDPTLLLKASDYDAIIDSASSAARLQKKYVAYMFLDHDDANVEKIRSWAKQKNFEVINLGANENVYRNVGEWLNLIKNAEYVITDSFHCVCFALIFHKAFLCVKNRRRGIERLKSLLKSLNLMPHLVEELDGNLASIMAVNYKEVDALLEEKKKISLDFLIKSLALPAKQLPKRKTVTSFLLFNKVILWRVVTKRNVGMVKLFNILPILKIIKTPHRRKYLLFGVLPFFTTKIK